MPEALARPLTPASFYQFLSEDRLMATRCQGCGTLYLPPRAICPNCQGEELTWEAMRGTGRLAAFTTIYVGSSAMVAAGYDRRNPYCTGIVELDEGVKISARILGIDAGAPAGVKIGWPVAVEFVHSGEGAAASTVLGFRVVL